jgi:hypothetical protein
MTSATSSEVAGNPIGTGMERPGADCTGMSESGPVVVVLVRPGTPARRSASIVRWVRWLLPAALLVVSGVPLDPPQTDDLITLDADDPESGPLSVADAIGKALERR